jgi:hypothetical protein
VLLRPSRCQLRPLPKPGNFQVYIPMVSCKSKPVDVTRIDGNSFQTVRRDLPAGPFVIKPSRSCDSSRELVKSRGPSLRRICKSHGTILVLGLRRGTGSGSRHLGVNEGCMIA